MLQLRQIWNPLQLLCPWLHSKCLLITGARHRERSLHAHALDRVNRSSLIIGCKLVWGVIRCRLSIWRPTGTCLTRMLTIQMHRVYMLVACRCIGGPVCLPWVHWPLEALIHVPDCAWMLVWIASHHLVGMYRKHWVELRLMLDMFHSV